MKNEEIIVVSPAGSSNHMAKAYEDYAYVIDGIQKLLTERYEKQFQMYVSDDGNEDYWELLEQDLLTSGNGVEFVARIYEHIESRAFAFDTEESEAAFRMFPTLRNNVFAYPEWGIALARVPVFRLHGIGLEDFVFAANDECLLRFLEHTRNRRRELDRCQVTVFTDGPHGIEKELSPITRMVNRDEVIMKAELKKEIYRSIDQFFAEDRGFFQEYQIPYKRGILLYGKPGNGKTTLVKSIAGSVNAPVAYWQNTEHTCSDTIQEVFQAAVNMAPMILVIEDIDSMPVQARSYFLNTLDGATSKEGIFMIGTTNYPEKIDPALTNRAGRFDRAYEIKLPDTELRLTYLRIKGFSRLLTDEEIVHASKLTEGFTFAQLNELYVSAALEWHYEKTVHVEKLVKTMKIDLQKGKTMNWIKEESDAQVGFLVR
ncbi:AAA family ATPase [Paenibacillus eucommiae]|uniref:AAA+ superfamily predicted ATPase n=1 Tax=Paenibacillus eucommiae TaxID=1355755 RepID=A0ABS4IR22_9BACL|nr:ATP-binding protein [Paenibacillus eucommiae]MBP1990015.1 AAA+ superfamily predicted ATPase [Paenibacillus eucommiae]